MDYLIKSWIKWDRVYSYDSNKMLSNRNSKHCVNCKFALHLKLDKNTRILSAHLYTLYTTCILYFVVFLNCVRQLFLSLRYIRFCCCCFFLYSLFVLNWRFRSSFFWQKLSHEFHSTVVCADNILIPLYFLSVLLCFWML